MINPAYLVCFISMQICPQMYGIFFFNF